jgi:hypothetical protein
MKRKRLILPILLLMMVLPITTVEAHTLNWGLEVDTSFEYTANGYRDDIGTIDLTYSARLNSLEPIPHEFELFFTWPLAGFRLTNLEDNTSLDMGNDISAHCWAYQAVPVNDWNYLSSIMLEYNVSGYVPTILENTTHWGYIIDHYLKENGIMTFHDGYLWSQPESKVIEHVIIKQIITPTTTTEPTTTDITTTSSSTEPDTGEPLGLSFDPILIGIVGGIGLISAVLVKRSMDGAKKVASDAKVLIICPYCGSKTEQGITKCQKCGADL